MGSSEYYAAIFTSVRNRADQEGYDKISQRMFELAKTQPGFLGVESARGPDGVGITVSYWRTLEDIRAWKENAEHLSAQRLGRENWYDSFHLRICKVEWEYRFGRAK